MIWFRSFLLSLAFLTVLPVDPLNFPNEKQRQPDLSTSMTFFPLIGLIIGGILVGFDYLLYFLSIDGHLINVLLFVLWVLISGGLHLEGLADTVDGFSGGKDKAEIIRIMKEGTIGAKGAIALLIVLILKLSFILYLPPGVKKSALLIAPMLGRWGMVVAGFWGKPASSRNTMSRNFTDCLGRKEMFLATLIALVSGFLIIHLPIVFFVLISLIVIWWVIGYAERKIGGISGDIIGMINELIELLVLFAFYFF